MAMSAGGGDNNTPMSDINTTPLVDIMLVLLIIFLIAVPVVLQTATLELPKVEYLPNQTKPENILLSIRSDPAGNCEVYRNTVPIDSTELLKMAVDNLQAAVDNAGGADKLKDEDIPEVHVRADVATPWRCIGGAIFVMQQAGFPRVGFISTPPVGG